MNVISRESLIQRMESEDLKLVEVLPRENYRKFHLPGAINIPLDEEFDAAAEEALPERDQPIVVYCLNEECNASVKAAKRLDEMGYLHVYDYSAGKEDWKEAGLPVE